MLDALVRDELVADLEAAAAEALVDQAPDDVLGVGSESMLHSISSVYHCIDLAVLYRNEASLQAAARVQLERRREAALQTRQRILDAATARFVEHGFGGTTIAAIAGDAATAAETVYATFGSKVALLAAVVSAAARASRHGDLEQAGLRAQPQPAASAAARAVRGRHQPALARTAPLLRVVAGAGAGRARAATAVREDPRGAPREPAQRAAMLAQHGPLRMDEETAAETFWALASRRRTA